MYRSMLVNKTCHAPQLSQIWCVLLSNSRVTDSWCICIILMLLEQEANRAGLLHGHKHESQIMQISGVVDGFKTRSFNKREAAEPSHTSTDSDSDVRFCFDIPPVLIAAHEQTCKQSGLCVSSHMGLKCWRVSVSVLVFPEAS